MAATGAVARGHAPGILAAVQAARNRLRSRAAVRSGAVLRRVSVALLTAARLLAARARRRAARQHAGGRAQLVREAGGGEHLLALAPRLVRRSAGRARGDVARRGARGVLLGAHERNATTRQERGFVWGVTVEKAQSACAQCPRARPAVTLDLIPAPALQMLAVQLGFACAPRARATACATARASHAQRACASLSAPHRSRVGASAAAHRASATLHHPLRRVGAAIRPADPVARTSGRIIGIARRAVDSDAADGALSNGDGVAATDDGDAPAAWLADDDDAEVCAASFEVTEAALHSLCHGNAPPPACTHEYCA